MAVLVVYFSRAGENIVDDKREIIEKGFIATLNVDKNNPISYHIYESIGFKKVFTQGIYKKN